jgi:hypothetical protein
VRLQDPPRKGEKVWLEATVLPGHTDVVGPFKVRQVIRTGHHSSAEWLVQLDEVEGRYPYRMFFAPRPVPTAKGKRG